ncbi:hypothetical protein SAMN07250955_105171 [Arboricoccus pini]|uniref:Uncharacterized protein n=1 Tax=Arboricoccus pini TaxID=1963835 RepID=A0A212R4B0_9PROT|nr:hypothetical protein [Arboricoccus pini]SNB66698.1 hypothetical protein SAMN07250955_105171 [Arboricoccus pini]
MSENEPRSHTFDRVGDREEAFETRIFGGARPASGTDDLRQRARGPFGNKEPAPSAPDPASSRQPLPPEEVVWTPSIHAPRSEVALSPRLFAIIAVLVILVVGGLAYVFLADSVTPPPPASVNPASPPAASPTSPPAAGDLPDDRQGTPDAAELERLRQDNQRLQNKLQGLNGPTTTPRVTQPAGPPDTADDPATLNHDMPVPSPRPTSP